jgi:hypothetical protein
MNFEHLINLTLIPTLNLKQIEDYKSIGYVFTHFRLICDRNVFKIYLNLIK